MQIIFADRVVRTLALTFIVIAISSCGRASRPSPALVATGGESSAVVEAQLPTVSQVLSVGFFFQLNVDKGAHAVQVFSKGVVKETLDPPGEEITYVSIGRDQVPPTVFVGVIDSDDCFQLYEYSDTDADNVPDDSSATLILDTAPKKAHVTDWLVYADGSAYLFDNRCKDILRAVDSDSDNLPDELVATPFLRSQDESKLLEARSISSVKDDPKSVRFSRSDPSADRFASSAPAMEDAMPIHLASDLTGDGVADSISLGGPKAHAPTVFGNLHDGQDSVKVSGPTLADSAGLSCVVATLQENGEVGTSLGSQIINGPEWVEVPLTSSLVGGQRVAIYYLGKESQRLSRVVGSSIPELVEIDASRIIAGETTQLIFTGNSFDPTMIVKLVTQAGDEFVLSLSNVTGGSATASLPTLGANHAGLATIAAVLPTQDRTTSGGFSLGIRICEAP